MWWYLKPSWVKIKLDFQAQAQGPPHEYDCRTRDYPVWDACRQVNKDVLGLKFFFPSDNPCRLFLHMWPCSYMAPQPIFRQSYSCASSCADGTGARGGCPSTQPDAHSVLQWGGPPKHPKIQCDIATRQMLFLKTFAIPQKSLKINHCRLKQIYWYFLTCFS